MRSVLAAPLALAAIMCGLLTYSEMLPQKAPRDAAALDEQRVEEGFGRLDLLPSVWPGMTRDWAALNR
ncbi:MAG TPA: hypothetical protein VLV50_12965 [Stellaceae bacterium]|nr:hypothetical protein [Stellaceae bacterium]